MSDGATVSRRTDEHAVLTQVSEIINAVLQEDGGADVEIGMDTRFAADLDMESIDLVVLSVQLQDHYGERVNFAEFIAELELDEITELSVGQLVRYVVRCHEAAGEELTR